jgi:hypothetical protein
VRRRLTPTSVFTAIVLFVASSADAQSIGGQLSALLTEQRAVSDFVPDIEAANQTFATAALHDGESDDDARRSGGAADGVWQLHSSRYLGGSRRPPDVEAADQDALPPDDAGLATGGTRVAPGNGSGVAELQGAS